MLPFRIPESPQILKAPNKQSAFTMIFLKQWYFKKKLSALLKPYVITKMGVNRC